MLHKSEIAPGADTWDDGLCKTLIYQLWALRRNMLDYERELGPWLGGVAPDYQASARKLAHYLALRETDHRAL
jgi:pyruvate kinase